MPQNVIDVGKDLVIVWDDGREDYLPLEKLRRECPCAMCRGERDILGNVYRGPKRPMTERSFQLVSHHVVGAYALQITWADGHNDGIYSYELLRRLGAES
ncbi:MAG TPA: DUF971 domain-containing protein [Thermoanaerobaculia bacterium]|nr:DUF971 domain-containing protein [Thermoanaerobaculia bacterium]